MRSWFGKFSPLRCAGPGLSLIAAAAALACGAWLRFHALDQAALWGDEVRFLQTCRPGMSVTDVADYHVRTYRDAGHLPLAAMICNIFYRVYGLSESALISPGAAKLPAAAAGMLTVPLAGLWLYLLFRNKYAGAAGMVLAALSFVHVWYSREAYYYSFQLLFAVVFLVSLLRADDEYTSGGTLRAACAGLSGLMLLLSHPAGSALNAAGAAWMAAAAFFRRGAARKACTVSFFSILLPLIVLLFLAREYQDSDYAWRWLRFPAAVTAVDLVDKLIFGPGWRTAFSLILLAAGLYVMISSRDRRQVFSAAMIPVLFGLLFFGAGDFPHRARYYLLLWPLMLAPVTASFLAFSARLHCRSAAPLLALAVSFIIYLPGYAGMLNLKSKLDDPVAAGRVMDECMDPGTVCFWQAQHLLAYAPGFYSPSNDVIIGSFPGANTESYVNGSLQSSLRRLAGSFPASSYIEWSGMRPYFSRFEEGFEADREWEAELEDVFHRKVVLEDPGLGCFMRTGWHPCAPPLLADEYSERMECEINAAAIRIYYTKAQDKGLDLLLRPAVCDWIPVVNMHGAPLLLADSEADIVCARAVSAPLSGASSLEFDIVVYRSGRLTIRAEDGSLLLDEASCPGEIKTVVLNSPDSVSGVRLKVSLDTGASPGEWPFFALIAWRVKTG